MAFTADNQPNVDGQPLTSLVPMLKEWARQALAEGSVILVLDDDFGTGPEEMHSGRRRG